MLCAQDNSQVNIAIDRTARRTRHIHQSSGRSRLEEQGWHARRRTNRSEIEVVVQNLKSTHDPPGKGALCVSGWTATELFNNEYKTKQLSQDCKVIPSWPFGHDKQGGGRKALYHRTVVFPILRICSEFHQLMKCCLSPSGLRASFTPCRCKS